MAIRLYMTTSLDGYVAGPRDGVDEPMGVGGFRLFNWLDRRDDPGPSGQVYAEVMGENRPARSTVAVVELPAVALVEIEAVAHVP